MDNGILFSLKNEVLITLPHWVNFKNNRLSLMRQTQRIKYCMNPLTRNIQNGQIHSQKADWKLPGAGGKGKLLLNSYTVFVWSDEKLLDTENSDGYTTV